MRFLGLLLALIVVWGEASAATHRLTPEELKKARRVSVELHQKVQKILIQLDEQESRENDRLVLNILNEVNIKTERLTDVLEFLARLVDEGQEDMIPAFQEKSCDLAAEIEDHIRKARQAAHVQPRQILHPHDPIFDEFLEMLKQIIGHVKGDDISLDIFERAQQEVDSIAKNALDIEKLILEDALENDRLVLKIIETIKVETEDFQEQPMASIDEKACVFHQNLGKSVRGLITAANMPNQGIIKGDCPQILSMKASIENLGQFFQCEL